MISRIIRYKINNKFLINYISVCSISGGLYFNYLVYKDCKKKRMKDEDIFYLSLIGSPFTLSLGLGIGMIIGVGSLITLPLGILVYLPIKIYEKVLDEVNN